MRARRPRRRAALALVAGASIAAGAPTARARVGSLADGGQIIGWGDNTYGQLTGIPGPGIYTAISTSGDHNLALRADGSIAAWGYDAYGQVSNTPTTGIYGAISGGGFHSLALRADGSIAAWGYDLYGQVSNTPTSGVYTAIDAGDRHNLALRSNGSLAAWGYDFYGQVSNTPTTGIYGAISAGADHSLALRADGSLAAWGYDFYGQVSNTPTTGVYGAISAGGYHNLALRADGSIAAWGYDGFGQVSNTPTGVVYTAIDAGFDHNLALRADGSIAAWGGDGNGQVSQTPAGGGFVAISAGISHSIALLGRTDYDGDLLISGTGVTADLNRSITVAGDTTVTTTVNFYNSPTATIAGKLILNPGADLSGGGSILCDGLDIETDVTLGPKVSLASAGPLGGSGNLTLDDGQNLTIAMAPAALYGGTLTLNGGSSLVFTGAGFQAIYSLQAQPASELRLSAGQQLRVDTGGLNSGTLNVIGADANPASFTSVGALLNTGPINARNAELHFTGGLTNFGVVGVSFGTSDLFGDITNKTGGQILLSGNNNTTFWNSLTNDAGATVDITTGSTAVFFGNVVNNGAFSGGGTKFFEGGSTGVMGSLVTTGSTVVEAGAAIAANRIREQALTVSGSAQLVPGTAANGASKVSSLSVTGTLDMTDNKMIVAGGTLGTWNGSSYSGITGLVQTGRNGGQWNGPGIVTTSAAPGNNLTTLGVASADQLGKVGQTFGGVTLNTGDVLVMYTYGGDANLDGKINIDDYGRIDGNVGLSGTVFGWYNGDFNYDGKINIDDYGIIDGNIGIQGAPIPTAAQTLAGFADATVTAVPEPMSLGLFAVLGVTMLRRRHA